jgi:outer membrane protein TolC
VRSAKQWIAIGLCSLSAGPVGWGQQSISPIRLGGSILGSYAAPEIPVSRLSNSARLASLIQSGKLYLTAQDAIALALENNIDIESNRYNALIQVSQYQRQLAGGPLAGVPSGSSQAGTVQSGQGVAGSQAAAGVSNSGSNSGGNNGTNATISQIGPVTPTLDPTFQSVETFSHKSNPQSNSTQSQISNVIDNTRNYQESLNSGFITGGKATLTFSNSYLNENAPSDLLNPSNGTTLTLNMQHNLLYGFGKALNARNITIANANIGINDLTFKTQVIGVVVNVLNNYYSLVADYQAVKANQEALSVAQRFFEDNKKQVQIGTMAPLDVTTAEAQVAASEQNLVVSETTLEQEQVTLKNLLSRNGLADPVLANVEIIPLDRIEIPDQDNLPSVKDGIAIAMTNRADLETDRLSLINSKTSTLGTSNGVLPALVAFGTLKTQGLSGTPHTVFAGTVPGTQPFVVPAGFVACPASFGPRSICEVPDKYFQGNIGTALGQMIRRDFPSQSGGVFFNPTLGNRQARADQSIDQLSLRQTELENERTINQVAVDVSNQLIGLQQARVRYQAAVKNRVLQQQLLDAEQKKFSLGASTTFNVVTQERDLATGQSTEVSALAAYSRARVLLDQTLGTTLKTNNVQIEEAQSGRVARKSTLPDNLSR